MNSAVFLCTLILTIFSLQIANGLELPYDTSFYQQVLSEAPYFSFCELAWPNFFDPSYSANFNEIALANGLRIDDVFQMHALIESEMPALPYPNEYNILSTTAYEMHMEMIRRGLYYLPQPPSCLSYPNMNPVVPSPVSPLAPVTPGYRVAKRSPAIVPPNYPTELTVTADLSVAYKNLYSWIDRYMPNLPMSTIYDIRDAIIANTPLEYIPQIDDLLNKLTTNMRYNLGMAERMMPSLH